MIFHKPAQCQSIFRVDPHPLKVVEAREVEADNDNKVRQDKDGAFEVIALSLAVHVCQQDDTEDYCNHVPLREDKG